MLLTLIAPMLLIAQANAGTYHPSHPLSLPTPIPLASPTPSARSQISPAAVGWGNLLVPGLGATLEDQPMQGLTEAILEIGSFYGGTLLSQESTFKIDGSTPLPTSGHVGRAAASLSLQQFGLKYHFYNTFYHYQQAVIAQENTPREKNNPQPIYRGDWKDMLAAPFQWENVSSIWSWPIILAASGYLIYDYAHTNVVRRNLALSSGEQSLYGFSQVVAVPIGSSFGEDPMFRGFMQREMYGMTGSLTAAILSQATVFAFLHEDRATAFAVGSYFGIETNALHGNLGPVMAAHFWINVVIGVLEYWTLERASGENAPLNPPVIAQFTIPLL